MWLFNKIKYGKYYRKRYCNAGMIILIIFITTFFSSCSKDDNGTGDNQYLLSRELKLAILPEFVTSLITGVSSVYPELSALSGYLEYGVDVYRVVYRTTLKGKAINASGLICVPQTPGEYPVLSFQNGTNTLNSEAPGNNPAGELALLIECIASMGYIVVIPDYPGFGASASEVHPYLIAEPAVTSITDMFYALGEFSNSGIPGVKILNKYYLLGYSQGGWATLALHKALEQRSGSGFSLEASVCGAGPYDLSLLVRNIIGADTYPMPVYLGYIINSYSVYKEFTNPVTDILNEPYASGLVSLYNGTKSAGQINGQLTTNILSLVNPGFISGFSSDAKYASVREAFIRNSISGWKTEIPLLLVHGGGDTTVDPGVTDAMYDAMISAGTDAGLCTKHIISGADHEEGVIPFAVEAMLFLNGFNKR
jgi:pimeloyl-ACP methyl ester carboxylesterase